MGWYPASQALLPSQGPLSPCITTTFWKACPCSFTHTHTQMNAHSDRQTDRESGVKGHSSGAYHDRVRRVGEPSGASTQAAFPKSVKHQSQPSCRPWTLPACTSWCTTCLLWVHCRAAGQAHHLLHRHAATTGPTPLVTGPGTATCLSQARTQATLFNWTQQAHMSREQTNIMHRGDCDTAENLLVLVLLFDQP